MKTINFSNTMKNTFRIFSIIALLVFSSVSQAQTRNFTFSNSSENEGLSIESNTRSRFQVRHSLKQMSLVSVTDNGYSGEQIQAGSGIFLPANPGEPNLPATSRFIAIPTGAAVHYTIDYQSMQTIRSVDLMAASPLPFDTDDAINTYEKDPSIYNVDAFYPASPVSISPVMTMRGVEMVALTVIPYQYNPVTKQLRVYDDLKISLSFEGGTGEFGDEKYRSRYFDPILAAELMNYDQLPPVDYEKRIRETSGNRPDDFEYLIVIPNNESFRAPAQQLAEYRTKQGIKTAVKSLSEMGCTTTNEMKTYFHNHYISNGLVAVLLLGDHNTNMAQGIPAEYTFHSTDYGNCITDNGYADVSSDNLPEMAFSRLVAANGTEAQMMVNKQLEYEYYNPNMDAASYDHPITALGWQTVRWFQICSEVVGGYWRLHGKHPIRINEVYEGTPGNQWSTATNTNAVVNYFGPNGQGYIPASPTELGSWNGGTGYQVVNAVNSGCMLLQHRDHGYYLGWGEPNFNVGFVNLMTNAGKLTFVNTINCQTGTFDYSQDCLVEAFMRRTYNGQNAGAVGCIAPTQTSYSFVNDTYVWGMYDLYDPQFMPSFGPFADYSGYWRPAFGNIAGKYFLAQSSWPYNSGSKEITYKMFTTHCDAFLTLYTQVPQTLSVTPESEIYAGEGSFQITAPAGSIIALSKNGNTVLACATATGSNQTINFEPQGIGTVIDVVVTKQDYRRWEHSITVEHGRPNLSMLNFTLSDANNNGQLDYSETASFNMTIRNSGYAASTATTATLSCTSPYITINNNQATFSAIQPGQQQTFNNVFGISAANNIPDQTTVNFSLHMVCGENSWNETFTLKGNAPIISISPTMNIHDDDNGNGQIDAGETARIDIQVTNNGHAKANTVNATLTSASPYINITNGNATANNVAVNASATLSFTVTCNANTPMGQLATFNASAACGSAYSTSKGFSTRLNLPIDNLESGDLSQFNWNNDTEHPWQITTTNPYDGNYCLRSSEIGNNASSEIAIEIEVLQNDTVSFFRRTSSQENDKLFFYIDDVEKTQISGNQGWREAKFPISAGTHTLRWAYTKDGNGTAFDDLVAIDHIVFPPMNRTSVNAGPDQDVCINNEVQLNAAAFGYSSLLWTTSGDGSFNDEASLTAIYTPGEQDKENGTVTLTLTLTTEDGTTISDDLMLTIHDNAKIVMEESASICYNGTYTTQATTENTSFTNWSTSGDGHFDNPNATETIYTPGNQDIENGFVTLTLNATSTFGCENASAETTLTIHPLQRTEFEIMACQSYNWNGTEYNESGDYEQSFESIHGCDSIVTMHLTIADKYLINFDITACDNYTWNGLTLTESGDYEQTFVSSIGCDSIVTLHLTINHSAFAETTITACDSYEWQGDTYTESGDYTKTFSTIEGCDSTLMLHLTIESLAQITDIAGDSEVDSYLTPISDYSIATFTLPTNYIWTLEPSEAGIISGQGNSISIAWNDKYKGTAKLNLSVTNDCGEAEKQLDINVKNSFSVGENEIAASIYPNPTDGNITIEAQSMKRIRIINASGQMVYDEELGCDSTIIDMTQFGAGLYLIQIESSFGQTVKRISVVR